MRRDYCKLHLTITSLYCQVYFTFKHYVLLSNSLTLLNLLNRLNALSMFYVLSMPYALCAMRLPVTGHWVICLGHSVISHYVIKPLNPLNVLFLLNLLNLLNALKALFVFRYDLTKVHSDKAPVILFRPGGRTVKIRPGACPLGQNNGWVPCQLAEGAIPLSGLQVNKQGEPIPVP